MNKRFLGLLVAFLAVALTIVIGALLIEGNSNAAKTGKALVSGRLEPGYEFVGYIISDQNKVCAGTLLDPLTIITAGHCLAYSAGDNFKFGINEFSLEEEELVDISSISFLTGFDPSSNKGPDVAIAKLARPINLTSYGQVNSAPITPSCEVSIVAYGAGISSGEASPDSFKRKSGEGCSRSISSSFFVEFNSEVGMCFGDSGGPVFKSNGSNEIIGVLSGGIVDPLLDKLRCDPGNVGLFYNLSNFASVVTEMKLGSNKGGYTTRLAGQKSIPNFFESLNQALGAQVSGQVGGEVPTDQNLTLNNNIRTALFLSIGAVILGLLIISLKVLH